MKRFLYVVMGLGVLAAFGGVGFLYFQSYNVLSGKLWTAAFRGLIDQPLALIGALDDPARRGLAGGLLATFGGILLFGMGLLLLNLGVLLAAVLRMVKRVKAKGATAKIEGRVKRPAARPARKFSLPKISLPKISKNGFRDETADLEGGRKSARLGDFIAKLRSAIPARKPARSTQVVIESGDQKTVLAEITEDTEFYSDLKEWHRKVKASSGSDLSLIDEAKLLRDRRTKAVADQVLEEDAMNGEFLMRMMVAWAEKDMAPVRSPKEPEVVRPAGPDTMMSAAIDDVMRNGIQEDEDQSEGIDLDDESFLPEHLFDDLDDEKDAEGGDIDLEDPANMLDIDPTEDRDVDLDDEDDDAGFLNPKLFDGKDEGEEENGGEEDADGEEASQDDSSPEERLEVDLKAIYELISTVAAIEQGMGEWPEYLQEESDRVAQLERAMMSISEEIETIDAATVRGWLDDNAGSPEWDWLAENLDRLDEERRDILETIVENGGADPGAGDDEDVTPTAAEDEPEDEIDDWSVAGPSATSTTTQTASDRSALEVPDAEAEGDEVEVEAVDEIAGEAVEQESSDTEKQEPEVVIVESPEQEPGPQGQDLGLDQLAEVEMCDDLLTKWGYSARGAGASEAKLVHTIVAKNGVKRKVVGVVHMVAGWKGDAAGDNRRLNVIFRYIPEGSWRFDATEGVRFVDDRENFVGVSQEMLDHPEMTTQKAVIHFYGPGVDGGLNERVSDRVLVVSKALNTEEVTELVFG